VLVATYKVPGEWRQGWTPLFYKNNFLTSLKGLNMSSLWAKSKNGKINQMITVTSDYYFVSRK
jgi:hypothetical protein